MIATLHHLPAGRVLDKLKHWLTADGVLIIHDLLLPDGPVDRLADLARLPMSCAWRWLRTGRPWQGRELRKAWADHGRNERYLTRQEVEGLRAEFLSGGYLKHHFLWRYTIVWCNSRGQAEQPLPDNNHHRETEKPQSRNQPG